MKYLKMFESEFQYLGTKLNDNTKKILKDFGLTESEYEEILKFIGKLGSYDVSNAVPFAARWNDFNFGYDQIRQILNYYYSKKEEIEKSEEIEDYFLDLIEDKSQSIEIKFNHAYQYVDISFDAKEMKDLTTLSKFILMIDERFKRANKKYKITNISNISSRVNDDTAKSYTLLRLKY